MSFTQEKKTLTQASGSVTLINDDFNGKCIYLYKKKGREGCEIYFSCGRQVNYATLINNFFICIPNNRKVSAEKSKAINTIIANNHHKPENFDRDSTVIRIHDDGLRFKINKDYLSEAQTVVAELNAEIPDEVGIHFVINYKMNMRGEITAFSSSSGLTSLLLCLYIKGTDQCVSSVEMLEEDDGEITISSMTDPIHEGLKYNKLNRAVVIMVAGRTGHKYVLSQAENEVSAWLMLNTFKGTINGEHIDYNPPNGVASFEYLEEYMMEQDTLYIQVEVNRESVELAHTVFSSVLAGQRNKKSKRKSPSGRSTKKRRTSKNSF